MLQIIMSVGLPHMVGCVRLQLYLRHVAHAFQRAILRNGSLERPPHSVRMSGQDAHSTVSCSTVNVHAPELRRGFLQRIWNQY